MIVPVRQYAGDKVWLGTAKRIGDGIVNAAIWYEDCCNWVGASVAPLPGGSSVLSYVSLGPDLYGGTSGIAMFLAELHAAVGEPRYRQTALGAIRHALGQQSRTFRPGEIGLYSGRMGVALAAAHVGRVLAEPSVTESARAIAVNWAPALAGSDVISGRAGAILGLLSLCDALDEPSALGFAIELGQQLVDAATKTAGWWSWASPGFPAEGHLAGFSHGAAGIGLSLYELADASGDASFRQAGTRAFDYERHLFDEDMRNWPDLRTEGSSRRRQGPAAFMTAWCHGAPGIALSRLRTFQLTNEPRALQEARVAVETTRRFIRAVLPSGTGNYSLCHGLAGNADVLLDAGHLLGSGPADTGLALAVAEAGAARYDHKSEAWPCGTLEGETPSLMLGLSGIGYFYLRLFDPTLPSLLQIRGFRRPPGLPVRHRCVVASRPRQRGGPATPITLPSGSAKCPTANSPAASSGPSGAFRRGPRPCRARPRRWERRRRTGPRGHGPGRRRSRR